MRIIIGGGGPAGLLLAHALVRGADHDPGTGAAPPAPSQQQPLRPAHTVLVLERDAGPGSRAQGFVIGLRQQAVDALVQVGLTERVRELFNETGPSGLAICNEYGRALITAKNLMLVSLPPRPNERARDFRSSLLDRALLRDALADTLPEGVVRWGARAVEVVDGADEVRVRLEDGTEVAGDVFVACDGANSVVRRQHFPELAMEELGVWMVAGVRPLSADGREEAELRRTTPIYSTAASALTRVQGRDGASLLLFAPGRLKFANAPTVLWAMSMPVADWNAELRDSRGVATSRAREMICEFARAKFSMAGLADMLAPTPDEDMVSGYMMRSVEEAAVREGVLLTGAGEPGARRANSRVTIAGDACHATTSQAGLGVTAAFADALDLADRLRGVRDFTPRVLREYERAAAARNALVVRMSAGNTKRLHVPVSGLKRVATHAAMWFVGWIVDAFARVFWGARWMGWVR